MEQPYGEGGPEGLAKRRFKRCKSDKKVKQVGAPRPVGETMHHGHLKEKQGHETQGEAPFSHLKTTDTRQSEKCLANILQFCER